MNITTIRSEDAAKYAANSDDQMILKALDIIKRRALDTDFFTSPDKAKAYVTLACANFKSEHFHALWLTTKHQLIYDQTVSVGTLDSATVYPRTVVESALSYNAGAVIFYHNHPSGICEPSIADKNLTEKLKQCLAMLDIRVLDHLVVGTEVYAFSEHGLI